MDTKVGQGSSRAVLVSMTMVLACLATVDRAAAQREVAQVTLLAGAPRMVGESIRPLQAILSGRTLETGEADAAGLLVEDIVFHVGADSSVTVLDEPGRKRIVLDRGFVVFYTDPATSSEVVVETPFGRITAYPGTLQEGGSGWYSVRHDPEQPNVSPAVSTFAAIEGPAEVEGTIPVAGPHKLAAGQRWRIVQGQIPGPPEAGDERAQADELRQMLHRQAAEMMRVQAADITRLTPTDLGGAMRQVSFDGMATERQTIIDPNAATQTRSSGPTVPPTAPTTPAPQPGPAPQEGSAIGDRTTIAAGVPSSAVAQFVNYPGTPADPDWNDFLTAVNGNPAFQPVYIAEFTNGGFSYLQLAGADAELATNNGETFLVSASGTSSGWANFTPLLAVADADFGATSSLVGVVTEGFRAIARGEHLGDDPETRGAIGGDGVDPATAFAVVSDGIIQLNPTLPPGYPLLDRAGDTTGLTVDDEAISDQIAALGAGRDPQQLGQAGSQLVFLSDSETDAVGNSFNFDGEAIGITGLDLPGEREPQTDTSGSASLASPLSADQSNTVGIQFAGRGETIAIIHHTGLSNPAEESLPVSEHFEVVRGSTHSVVQWREGERVTDDSGQVLEVEDLNSDPELRNELFAVVCAEVNNVVPPDRHTLCGPALAQPGAGVLRQLRRQPGSLVRLSDRAVHRRATVRPIRHSAAVRSLKVRSLKSAGGRLVRNSSPSVSRRHVGRVSSRR